MKPFAESVHFLVHFVINLLIYFLSGTILLRCQYLRKYSAPAGIAITSHPESAGLCFRTDESCMKIEQDAILVYTGYNLH
jgi:hypothetical protein